MKYLACALTVFLGACGGAIDTNLLDGGDGGGGGNDGSQQDGTTSDAPANTCDALAAQIANAEAAATECCPTCNVQQCTQQVAGLCCPLTVTNPDSAAVKSYEAALKAYNDAKCVANCPAIACSTKPSGMCMQTGSSGQCSQM
jgi:hypothetical protein